ncbi:histidine phosphatase family protein [Candidatus Curtissbacteria bacterium]|nr:histidine phosphatase family protein [Candidatus Curtissbacteria bacterium]
MVTLIIARHCESTWNVAGKLAGQTDKAVLTSKGKSQALEIASKFEKYNINSIYSSGLKRSIQTAEVLAKYLGKTIIKDSRFNERSWGKLEGRLDSEIRKELENRFTFTPPAGESFSDFEKRIVRALLNILRDRKVILVISHGGVKEVFEMLQKQFNESFKSESIEDFAVIVTGKYKAMMEWLQKSYN